MNQKTKAFMAFISIALLAGLFFLYLFLTRPVITESGINSQYESTNQELVTEEE